jgi:DNA-binding CsgD family transcriptional regulator
MRKSTKGRLFLSVSDRARARRLLAAGKPMEYVAKMLCKPLAKLIAALTPAGGPRVAMSAAERQVIKRRARRGQTTQSIATELKRSHGAVKRVLTDKRRRCGVNGAEVFTIWNMAAAGRSIADIQHELKRSYSTVRRYLRVATPSEANCWFRWKLSRAGFGLIRKALTRCPNTASIANRHGVPIERIESIRQYLTIGGLAAVLAAAGRHYIY